MVYIEFGQIQIKLIILLIYPVGIIFARYFTMIFSSNPLYYLFLFFISHFLTLIPLGIYKIRKYIRRYKKKKQEEVVESENQIKTLSPVNNDNETIKNQINILKEKIKKDKKKVKILMFLLIAFLYFSTYVFFYYFNYITRTNFYGNISMVTEVVYLSLFNWIILGNKVYAHHFFSMILITISILGIYILSIVKYIDMKGGSVILRDFVYPSLLNLIVYCPFCFYLVLGKSYVEKYFISPYEHILYLGIFCLSLLIIFEPITFYIPCSIEDTNIDNIICDNKHFAGIISGFKNANNLKGIFCSLGIGFTLFMTTLGLWLTIKLISPLHFLSSDSIITLELNILVDSYNDHMLINNPLFYILSLITIFACLVYNEIIIINICGINYNTRKEIMKRQSKDLKYIHCELPELGESYTGDFNTTDNDNSLND